MKSNLSKLVLWGAVGLCVVSLSIRVAILFWGHNYNVAAEANGLYGILELADGKDLYPQKSVRPYFVYLYPPLHPYFSAAFLKIFDVEGLRERVLSVRFLSILFGALSLLLLWACGTREKFWKKSFFGLVALLALSKLVDYLPSSRNDCFAMFLELGAFASLLAYIRGGLNRTLVMFVGFAVLAVWSRQNAVSIVAAGSLWLIINRKYREGFATAFGFAILASAGYGILYLTTHGEMVDHLILSNIRGFRPLNREFFDASLLSFLGSIALFLPLALFGVLRREWNLRSERGFFLLSFVASLTLSGAVFMRAGGDVNYFFLPLALAIFFAAEELGLWFEKNPHLTRFAVAGQLLMVAVFFGMKTRSALRYTDLNYEKVADQIRERFPKYVVLKGIYSQNMGIHLRDWAYHGPDVSNAGSIARNGHFSLRWMLRDLDQAIVKNDISAVLYVHPDCAQFRQQGEVYDSFPMMDRWNDWICVYTREAPTGLARKYTSGVDVVVNHRR